jgi:hypothetical protein
MDKSTAQATIETGTEQKLDKKLKNGQDHLETKFSAAKQ